MKKANFKYVLVALAAVFAFSSCEDDTPITAAGDPLDGNVVNLEATVTPAQMVTGEGNILDYTVTLPNSFSSDVTVTARITLDNGQTNIGTATIAAGSTTGEGSVTVPADDDLITGTTVGGVAEAAKLTLIAIALDEQVEGTTYTITSNTADLGVYADTLPADNGLNILFDWEDPATNDLDLYVIDRAFTFIFAGSETGSRFEDVLFENATNDDGVYDIYTFIFTASPAVDLAYDLLITSPDGSLEAINGVIPAGTPAGNYIPLATFEKSTDAETGDVNYINISAL